MSAKSACLQAIYLVHRLSCGKAAPRLRPQTPPQPSVINSRSVAYELPNSDLDVKPRRKLLFLTSKSPI